MQGESKASLVTQLVKNLPAMQETWIQFLGGENPLEKGMAIHSSILAWEIPWIEEPGGLQSMGLQRVRHDWMSNIHTHIPRYSLYIRIYFYHEQYCLVFVNPFSIVGKVNSGGGRENDILATFREHNLTAQMVGEKIAVHI